MIEASASRRIVAMIGVFIIPTMSPTLSPAQSTLKSLPCKRHDMWLSVFEIVLRDRVIPNGAVRIENGRIAEIREKPVGHADIEGGGRLLLPGFIDMHGDMVEGEVEPRIGVHVPMRIGIAELDKKLASCGITTAYAALSSSAPASPAACCARKTIRQKSSAPLPG
ncbi:hypothetical protein [Mesorhizobium sp. WSM4310]|uniref:hypothetical protein n=1 Tax=Mesorhizobium sp. WSM4310 TaxID=2589883 RepID=UPI0032B14398